MSMSTENVVSDDVHPEFASELILHIKSRQPAVLIPTNETVSAIESLKTVSRQLSTPEQSWAHVRWDPNRGFSWDMETIHSDGKRQPLPLPPELTQRPNVAGGPPGPIKDPLVALEAIARVDAASCRRLIVILTDFHHYLFGANPQLRARFKNMVAELEVMDSKVSRLLVLLVPPDEQVPGDIRANVVTLQFPLPGVPQIEHVIRGMLGDAKTSRGQADETLIRRAAQSALGLGISAVEMVVANGLSQRRGLDVSILDDIEARKANLIKSAGYLNYVPSREILQTDLGGFENARDFIELAAQSYKPDAPANLKKPRGAILIGVPGTGKTVFAKWVGALLERECGLRFVTYFLNVPALFGSLVGQTEQRVAHVIATLQAQGNYVLVIDEFEKFLGNSGAQGDSGVSQRASGQLLTWLAERQYCDQDRGYVIATMNTTRGVEPEYFRRFDGTFWTGLPGVRTRKSIVEICLRRAQIGALCHADGQPINDGDMQTLLATLNGFVGSEIEDVVNQAQRSAWRDRRSATPNFSEVLTAAGKRAKNIMSVTHKATIDEITAFCQDCAIPVSNEDELDSSAIPVHAQDGPIRPSRRRQIDASGS
jgi:ATP-dependent 26S proteasome regulatory subunit